MDQDPIICNGIIYICYLPFIALGVLIFLYLIVGIPIGIAYCILTFFRILITSGNILCALGFHKVVEWQEVEPCLFKATCPICHENLTDDRCDPESLPDFLDRCVRCPRYEPPQMWP